MDVNVIGVPYHLDEYLPDLDLPLKPVAALGIACTWHPRHGAAQRVAPDLAAALADASFA